MSLHDPRPLPSTVGLPYGLIRITVWHPDPDQEGRWSGTQYTNSRVFWRPVRGGDSLFRESVDWSFDGFNLDYFNRAYLVTPNEDDDETPDLVRLAMWALERFAEDKGLT